VTVVKVAKPFHDMRFDVPCVGLRTVESLSMARAGAFAVQADKTFLVNKPKIISACNEAGIALVGVSADDKRAE